jgi:hypothetical protein
MHSVVRSGVSNPLLVWDGTPTIILLFKMNGNKTKRWYWFILIASNDCGLNWLLQSLWILIIV